MSENGEDFFAGKRPWSIIKDQTLQKYMTPYLAKVNRLGRSILLIDAYAGPGIFDDGELGSPCIMCEAAETYAKVGYQAFFVNNDEKYQKKLEAVLQQKGWSHSAHALLEDSYKLLQRLPSLLRDNTVFLYLDPFGLKGCEFALLEPFLRRDARYSTEILLTMNMPVVHRLAARTKEVVDKGRLQSNRERLTKVFGGDYWKDILSQPSVRAEDKEKQLIEAYLGKLQHYLPFTGSCPVREQRGSRIKYFIVFASRSPDAMLLLNDIMVNAYFSRMHQADFGGGLFQNFSWREMPPAVNTEPRESLEAVILQTVAHHLGAKREDIWLEIVKRHFMRYLQSDYKKVVNQLVFEKKLTSPTLRRSLKVLNDDCLLYLP